MSSVALPGFYAELEGRSATAAKALQFAIPTACRTSEVLAMMWDEVEMDARLWTIPASRIKGGVQRRVPLTDEMLSILKKMKMRSPSGNPAASASLRGIPLIARPRFLLERHQSLEDRAGLSHA